MPNTADIIIVGAGVIGCSTAYHLATHRPGKIVVLERDAVAAGGTRYSCAIIRTHYSIPINLRHAVESLKVFSQFDQRVGGEVGWRRTGYIIVGPKEHEAPMKKVFAMQTQQGIRTEVISSEQARALHPLLDPQDAPVIGYDSEAGYADPVRTTQCYAQRARELGAEIREGVSVRGLSHNGSVTTLQTNEGEWSAPVVCLCAGPWTQPLTSSLGLNVPLEVSRHKVLTLRRDQTYQRTWPIIKDLTSEDKIYFRPTDDGAVLVGTGDHGEPVADPEQAGDPVNQGHIDRMRAFTAKRMPAYAEASCSATWTGLYDITPDWNPILGPLGPSGLHVAVGFSGHGFKLAPTIGESLAQSLLGQKPELSISEYSLKRFSQGQTLCGAYGVGAIS